MNQTSHLFAGSSRQPAESGSLTLPSIDFLQTSPLASDAHANRILFPMNMARLLTSSDGVYLLRWANEKGLFPEAQALTFGANHHSFASKASAAGVSVSGVDAFS